MIEIQGHRGARGSRPENTLPSFEFALDVGVDSIETDIHLTADAVPVLVHDAWLGPEICPGRPRVRELTFAQLRQFRVAGNPDPRRFPEQQAVITPVAELFARQRGMEPYAVPTLADFFAFVVAYAGELGQQAGKTASQQERARRLIFDLELKALPIWPQQPTGELEQIVAQAIDRAGTLSRCRVRSFDHRMVAWIKKLVPALETAILIAATAPIAPEELAQQAGAAWYCPDGHFVDEEQIARCHAAGIRVLPWTVNDPDHWRQLLAWGIDGITTDFPERLIASPAAATDRGR